ncbi:MAG TPA: N-acetylmuramoyl-L-alanine amidase [Stellaceae bacterium]|jgi:N-acetylmuramoyl-L-alanine amidase|nr:N-acetylmuramoyl-L-alanine amidase [Stellaceae bacterium]
MPEITIARRALLALAVGIAVGVVPIRQGAARGAQRRRRPPPPKPRRVIALDPGHGGVDPGAISPHRLYEKTITLGVARELARQLDATGRYRAVLTRATDTFVPLRQRVARARASRAELFLSIHADALPDSAMRGLSVYTLSEEASDREAAALASRENKDDFVAGLHLKRQPKVIGAILLDLAQRQTNNQSLMLARTILGELGRSVPLLEKPHRSAGFVVLTAPDIPSVLVELGCLSNPVEERLLSKPAHQRRLAQGLVRAIDDYCAAAIPA